MIKKSVISIRITHKSFGGLMRAKPHALHKEGWDCKETRWRLFSTLVFALETVADSVGACHSFVGKHEFELVVYYFICLFTVSSLGRPVIASSTISSTPRVQSGKLIKFVFIFSPLAC